MPSSTRRKSHSESSSSRDSRSRRSRKSNDSYESQGSHSTTPSSFYASPKPSEAKTSMSSAPRFQPSCDSYEQDLSPATNCYPRSSHDTYASTTASEGEMESVDDMDGFVDYERQNIPELPTYRREITDANVRPSTPQDFAKLFPSMNRLSIRHDEFTTDGNMNLRVDTLMPGRKRHPMQLFHLRMYDLAKREFSLRRYCRDSGREVCNSKRHYTESAPEDRPTLQRSMTSAFKSLGGRPAFGRTNSGGSIFSGATKTRSSKSSRRPSTSSSYADGNDEFSRAFSHSLSFDKKAPPLATNLIKLEFSNYARVDVKRRGSKNSKRYDFDWWGHKYTWKRVTEKHLNVVSFHLLQDGKDTPIAHIVPETRSPNQIMADEEAGGWIPPCHMWIADKKVVNAATDVADVIVSTGLIALVDDSIKELWGGKKIHRIPVPLTSKSVDVEYVGPKAFMQHVFGRRNTDDRDQPSSYRFAQPVSTY